MKPSPPVSQALADDRLWLAPHVRACDCGGHVILLDLLHSRYLGIGQPASTGLAARVVDWPTCDSSGPSFPGKGTPGDLAQDLLARGLLVRGRMSQLTQPSLAEPTATIDLNHELARRHLSARRILQFAASAATAAWWMRFLCLQAIANAIVKRRGWQQAAAADPMAAMRSGTAAYEALRPLLLTARKECLLDSLALIAFLAMEGVFPRWVLGVKTAPFGAHSWVQSGRTVLNDQHEQVRRFRPILVV